MRVEPTEVPEVLEILPRIFEDGRGLFFESHSRERYAAAAIAETFVQDNVSRSHRGVLRGLHLQHPHAQGKLVCALEGEVFDVACDVRVGSPTFGAHVARVLSSSRMNQLWIPPGFAHGFAVLSKAAIVHYKCTALYRPEAELGIAWNDRTLGIEWPITEPVLSDKDRANPRLDAIPPERLPRFVR